MELILPTACGYSLNATYRKRLYLLTLGNALSLGPKLNHPTIPDPLDVLQIQTECENGGIAVAFQFSIDVPLASDESCKFFIPLTNLPGPKLLTLIMWWHLYAHSTSIQPLQLASQVYCNVFRGTVSIFLPSSSSTYGLSHTQVLGNS